MNVIINENEFSTDKISLTNYLKIIYTYKNINLLGISFMITNSDYKYNHNKRLINITFNNQKFIDIFNDIDNYFSKKYKKYKNSLKDKSIQIKNINLKDIQDKKELYININSLKTKDFILYLNIFTL